MGTHSTDAPPLLLPPSETIDRALKVLDHIPPYNTHKIGVIYVGEGQSTEQEILSNTSGSSRYLTLIKGLGRTINLSECTSDLIYLGGLDTDGADGQLTCYWEDDITQVIFHVATLMPTVASNPNCSNKKLHIGNNFVTIVYNDSESPFQFGTIKGQFNYAEVIVQPLTCGMNCVSLAVKKGLDKLIDCSSTLISDKWLPILVRQKALLANLASLVLLSQASHDHYPSNWLGRLKQIRRIREKILSDSSSDKRNNVPSNVTNNDFTLYC
jgi:tuberous sclerosis protein 2